MTGRTPAPFQISRAPRSKVFRFPLRGVIPAALSALLLTGPSPAAASQCEPEQSVPKKKAKTTIVTYPNQFQDYFSLEVHVALANNYRTDLQGSTSPISESDQPHYCEAINQWAKSLYVATEGLYRVRRADFWNIDSDLDRGNWKLLDSPFHIFWALGWDFHEAFWPKVARHADGSIFMSDAPMMCTGERFVDGNGDFTFPPSFRCDADLVGVGGFHGCQVHDVVGAFDWAFCADGGSLLESSEEYLGNVLHHEGGHFLFSMPDEGPDGAACFSELDRDVADGACGNGVDGFVANWTYDGPMDPQGGTTSVMAVGAFRTNFCDDSSHLHFIRHDYEDQGGGQKILRNDDTDLLLNPSMWSILREFQPGFDNGAVHTDGVFDTLNEADLTDINCFFHQDVLANDPVMVLDRSGSMDFSLPPDTDYMALDAAKEAAINLYNLVPDGIYSGVVAYNASPSVPVPYEAVSFANPLLGLDDLPFGAGGDTDIEEAIQKGTELILLAQAEQDNLTGNMILLTDGKPTSPDRTDEEHWAATVQAAVDACEQGNPPIRIYAMAFGNANEELLHAVTSACDGKMIPIGGNKSSVETPLDYKETFTRAGYDVRGRLEILHERQQVIAPATSFGFWVPDSSADLEFTWLGKPSIERTVGGSTVTCSFSEYSFELETPSSIVLQADAISPVGAEELAYGVRTARVANPEPGSWIARLSAPVNCIDLQPEIVWIGGVRNGWYHASLDLFREVAARDEPVIVEASMFYADKALINVGIVLEVWNDGALMVLNPVDDGTAPDRIAGDGIYAATVPGLLPGEAAGSVTLDGIFQSFAGLSMPAPAEFDPILDGPTPDGTLSGLVPGDGILLREETLLRLDCCLVPDPLCTVCPSGATAAPELPGNSTIPGASVEICGLPLLPGRVQVGAGPDIRLSNLGSSFDPGRRCGTLTFDAAVDPGAAIGPRPLKVESGGRRLQVDDALIICTSDGSPFVEVSDFNVRACGTATVPVQLPQPTALRSCGEPDLLSVAASVISFDGVPQVPPIPVDPATLVVDLPDGIAEILWDVTDLRTLATATATQLVDVTIACGSGRIPDGRSATGTPLQIELLPTGEVLLIWDPSCVAQDVDFSVYGGSIGSFASHVPVTCSTGGSTVWQFPAGRGDEYYLVVPSNAVGQEGSYGLNASGSERPASPAACFPQSVLTCG